MIKKDKYPLTTSLALITFLPLLAYAVLIPLLGFYSDDFFYIYVGHFYGSRGLIESLSIDRPLDGYLLSFYYSIIGNNLLYWHILVFFLRLLGGYVLFFALRKLWPDKLSTITSITLLFLLYPGFLQQVGPIGYQNILTALLSWLISLFFTVYALKNSNKIKIFLFTLLSIPFQLTSFFLVEYFIGMEVFRLLLIMYIISNNKNLPLKNLLSVFFKKVIYWSPYVLSLVLFLLWRIFLFKSTREVTDLGWVIKNYYSNPLWIFNLPLEIIYSFFSALVASYLLPIAIRFIRIPIEQSVLSFAIGAVFGFIFYLLWKNDSPQTPKASHFGKKLLVIGATSSLGALLPIIISGRNIRLAYNYDRYTITSVLSITFIIMGLLTLNILAKRRQLIISLLITLSIATHLTNGFLAAANWNQQKDIWWQLYWRAPNIKDNAMLVLDFPALTQPGLFNKIINKVKWYRIYWVDYQIWTPGNLFFKYNNTTDKHFNGDFLEDKQIIDKIKNKVIEPYRYVNTSITSIRNFNDSVVISTPGDRSCLWVLDKGREELPANPSKTLRLSVTYSDTSKLLSDHKANTPPTFIFGNEPSHAWCYYFEKASLTRQLKDWDKLSQLTQEVIEKNLKPKDPNEWLPFIEGLIVSKQYNQAKNFIRIVSADNSSATLINNLCKMLNRLQTNFEETLNCSPTAINY